MKYQNNATLIRREIMIRLARSFIKSTLLEDINRIPLEMNPKDRQDLLRCCIYKGRAIIRDRILALLGFDVAADDECTPLAEYAKRALKRQEPHQGPILSMLDIACSGCVKSRYVSTNACRGCMARPCLLNCPKKAIKIENGQSVIDYDLCIGCGKCAEVCPYHAIIKIPVPCEEVCPVGAINKDEHGKANIDFTKCIFCGRCMVSCPFGAVMEISHFFDVLKLLQDRGKKVVAMVAPAIAGNQFRGTLAQIATALKNIGFSRVVEVAGGADVTSNVEAKEFCERMEKGDKFMTTSCCPAYTEAVKKHIPDLEKFVSDAKTPLHYTANKIKDEAPEEITVFIGPCIAKRFEAENDAAIDFVLTFEEIDALFAAHDIEITKCTEGELENKPSDAGRGFATTCGVTEALLKEANQDQEIKTEFIDGLNKESVRKLKSYANRDPDFNFLEVMACEGGCVGGPCAIGRLKEAQKAIRKIAGQS